MTLSNLTVKAAGLFFKIPMTALIGEEGMGYFNSAYTLFTWLYMLLAAGLPVAVSSMIARIPESGRKRGAVRVFLISQTVFSLAGILGSVLMVICAGPVSELMQMEASRLSVIAIAPTLFFICQSAALRGYFQGLGDLRPHSFSQVVEALGKLFVGVALARYEIVGGADIPTAAAMACVGITVGVAAGMLVLYLSFIFTKKGGEKTWDMPYKNVLRKLMICAFPVTLSSSVMSLAGIIDSFVMTRSLHASGMSQSEAAAVWGNYSSLAVPMFNLPPVLTLPIAYALLPNLASAMASGKAHKARQLTEEALERTLFLAVPCAVGLSAMSKPILSLLFEDEVAERGALLLTVLAPATVLLCLAGLTNTVLQACGRERIPLYAMLSGAFVKLSATELLTPCIGKSATPVSTFLCYFAAVVISVFGIERIPELRGVFTLKHFLLPTAVSLISVCGAVLVYPITGTLLSVGFAAVTYFGIMCIIMKTKRRFVSP